MELIKPIKKNAMRGEKKKSQEARNDMALGEGGMEVSQPLLGDEARKRRIWGRHVQFGEKKQKNS